MICQDKRARNCAGVDVQVVRIKGDPKPRQHSLCADCRDHYARVFQFDFAQVAA